MKVVLANYVYSVHVASVPDEMVVPCRSHESVDEIYSNLKLY